MTNENALFTAIAKALLRQAGYVPFLWHVTDLRCLIEDRGLNITLSTDECLDILENADGNHDANIGMNWDVLEAELAPGTRRPRQAPPSCCVPRGTPCRRSRASARHSITRMATRSPF